MDFSTDFEFVEGMYDDQLFDPVGYEFTKHFLGADKVGKMDTAEELACAREINRLEEVECWIGKAMERASGGQCLFLMVFKMENGLDMRAQLKKKITG